MIQSSDVVLILISDLSLNLLNILYFLNVSNILSLKCDLDEEGNHVRDQE
jgi:hypothetical protein